MNTVKNYVTIHFLINLYRFVGSRNTLDDLSNKVCVPSKTEDQNLSVFNKITETNESKTLTKHISCECTSTFDSGKRNSNQNRIMIDVGANVKVQKLIMYAKKIIFGILLYVIVKMVNI